jgi:hypothetical protein
MKIGEKGPQDTSDMVVSPEDMAKRAEIKEKTETDPERQAAAEGEWRKWINDK